MKLHQNEPVPWDMTKEEIDAEIERHIMEKRKYIGQEWILPTETKWFGVKNRTITADLIKYYCDCVGDLNPLFLSEDYASNTRWGGIIAPPMIIHYVAMVSGGIAIEPPDVTERGFRPRIHGVNGLNMGGLVRFYEPIRPGDKFVCIDKLVSVDEVTKRENPNARRLRMIGQRKFINQHGKVAVAASGVELLLFPEKSPKKGEKQFAMGVKYPDPWDHYYTDEEIALIDKAMYAEEIRGSKIRYWEDVNEGDELVPLVKGPLTVTDIAAGQTMRGTMPCMEVRRMVDKSDDHYGNIDPRTGDMFGEYRSHHDDALAQMYGQPSAFATGTQFLEWVCHITTNWMGDDGFMTALSCRSRRVMPIGDTCWVKGRVVRKYIEGDEHLVDIAIEGTSWFGHTILTGSTTVRLISKEPASWGKYMFASQ